MTRRKSGAANETINRELSVIRRMLSIARQDRTISHIPHFPMLEPGQPRESYLSPSEFLEILKHLPEHDRGIVRWVWNTGWRITAACKLAWNDVNIAERYVVLTRENAKNKRPQKIPLVGELSLIISEASETKRADQPLVFHHSDGQPFRRESVWRAFKKACAKAGLGSDKTLHDMRRSAARDLIRTGVVSEDVARRITGHQTRAVFSRYNITADNDVAQALVALQEHRGKRQPAAEPSTVTELSPSQGSTRSPDGTPLHKVSRRYTSRGKTQLKWALRAFEGMLRTAVRAFHVGNTGSNPVGDAIKSLDLRGFWLLRIARCPSRCPNCTASTSFPSSILDISKSSVCEEWMNRP